MSPAFNHYPASSEHNEIGTDQVSKVAQQKFPIEAYHYQGEESVVALEQQVCY